MPVFEYAAIRVFLSCPADAVADDLEHMLIVIHGIRLVAGAEEEDAPAASICGTRRHPECSIVGGVMA